MPKPEMSGRNRTVRSAVALRCLPLAIVLALAGCSLAPPYKTPAVPVAPSYRNAPADSGMWQAAQPSDQLPRDRWWQLYHDAQLDRLQQRLLTSNADIAAALAHYRQAQAFDLQSRSALFPTVSTNANGQRDRESDTKPLRGATSPADYNSFTVGAEADYELDLWGRIRNTVEASKAETLASAADLASAQLSLQAQLADNYIQLRGLDQQIALFQQSIDAYQKALKLTQTLHTGGIVSGLDVARAQSQLSTAKSLWSQAQAQRALIQDAIAVLVGESASTFELAAQTDTIDLPPVPTGVPSTLLQRRPDIAAAERRVAEANARIGIARAAYFPSLTLSAQGGFQSAQYPGLLTAPNHFWAIGPSLFETIFDGGKRKAGVRAAKAATDEAGARYRSVALNAFAQVEDNLAQIDHIGVARTDQKNAADAAQHSVDLSMDRYKEGAVGYLDVVQAQTTALDAQRSLLGLNTNQLRASVQLIKALGGGWSTDRLSTVTH
ncbi:NodT family efflux transporter outer membrane factor (OMF) lipoprotein [Rhodanobacter sp. ANJX3]|uniref:efflux transporter outer membrane subunit n=1 Tax=Rhodanobacter sp. ANJX3 TaxID=2723083 RepID=UPI0018103776|nr:efflux transporter outer membrane subunit [Rhodanobacter sp. ANJX3]MBB5359807.1 NodT family efflux transporter outer membrane factor (OMF) lipoprotein [Rhodanobacter sp. ANJX3]